MVGTHRIYINRVNNNTNNIGRHTMPSRSVKLKEGYIEDLMNNYDDCNELHQLVKKIKMHVNTLRRMNQGIPIAVNSIKKIADYFGIQERYIENSILTEEEAREFLKKQPKKYDIPQIMTQSHVEMWDDEGVIINREMGGI